MSVRLQSDEVVVDLGEIVGELRAYVSERAQAMLDLWRGLATPAQLEAVEKRHAAKINEEDYRLLTAAASESGDGEESLELKRLALGYYTALVEVRLSETVADVMGRVHAARLDFRDEQLGVFDARARVGRLSAALEREELGARLVELEASFAQDILGVWAAAEAVEAELSGIRDPRERSRHLAGIDPVEVAEAGRRANAALEDEYRAAKRYWFERLFDSERDDVPYCHLWYLMTGGELGEGLPAESAEDVIRTTAAEIGLPLEDVAQLRFDLAERPGKAARPYCSSPDLPHDVWVVARPTPGLNFYRGLIHEIGHGLHFGLTDAQLPWALRNVASSTAVVEIYSIAFEYLPTHPEWFERHFGFTPLRADECAALMSFLEAFALRFFVAQIDAEQFLRSRAAAGEVVEPADLAPFAQALAGASGFRFVDERAFAHYVDRDGNAAGYLQAALQAAQLHRLYHERYGADWWRRPETGRDLRQLLRTGLRYDTAEVARAIGAAATDECAIVEMFSGRMMPRG